MSQDLVHIHDPVRRTARPHPADALVEVARLAAGAWFRAGTWSLGVSIRAVRSSGDPQALAALAGDVVETVRELMQGLLGISDANLDARIKRLLPPAAAPVEARGENFRAGDLAALRRQAAELLRHAADVDFQDGVHPAFARIVLELAPDEARILRLLCEAGPQPAVDVRGAALIGSGEVVAEGLNMIGVAAGAREPERAPVYLDNLSRLGLVQIDSTPLEDLSIYQVLEAQPDVMRALRDANRARTVHRRICLTLFGEDFCSVCLPPQVREQA
jgi:Abortive infection alpha